MKPNVYLALGLAIGTGVGVALHNLAVGAGVGIAIGAIMMNAATRRERGK